MALVISSHAKRNVTPKLSLREGAEVFAKLRRQAAQHAILRPDYGYYFRLIFSDVAGLGLSVFFLTRASNFPLVVLASICVGFFAVHMGGLVHDCGHRAMFRSPRLNDLCGYIFGSLVALPYQVWCIKHNAHHAHTNIQGEDPDLEIPFAFTEEENSCKTGLWRSLRRVQHWTYFPLGSLVVFSFRIKGWLFFARNLSKKVLPDILLLSLGMVVWYVLPFWLLPLWKALPFFVVANLFGGVYMMSVFAPNHKGMPQLRKGAKFSFFEQMVVTSRNLRPSPILDYLFLGLNYQIEHHLFPSCPRNKLDQVRPLVRAACRQHQLPYLEMGPIETDLFIFKKLRQVAQHN